MFVVANVLFFYYLNFYFYFILLYNTVLGLPYIDMNPPRVYMSSQTWTPLPPPSPYHLSQGHPSAQPPSILYPASNIDWRFVSYKIVYMFQCHSPKSSHPLPLSQSPKVRSVLVLKIRIIQEDVLQFPFTHFIMFFFFLPSILFPPLVGGQFY